MKKILLKTTIPSTAEDWSIARFSLLAECLAGLRDKEGRPEFEVEARDRCEDAAGNDPDLSGLAASDIDQLWLFAVDVTGALTPRDVAGIDAFRRRGGACMLTRDHADMGSCLSRLPVVGRAHHFRTIAPESELERQARDDPYTMTIDWPNYHSGANGDYQTVTATEPLHPVMQRADGTAIRYLPAHPHEGAVSAPDEAKGMAVVVATGASLATRRRFNIAVAFEGTDGQGRALAEATFHRFADYNWEPSRGAPAFVTEPVGSSLRASAEAWADTRAYVGNIARWLGPAKTALAAR